MNRFAIITVVLVASTVFLVTDGMLSDDSSAVGLTYSFSDDYKTLTYSGEGEISSHPNMLCAENLVIGEGVTKINYYAFMDCTGLYSVA